MNRSQYMPISEDQGRFKWIPIVLAVSLGAVVGLGLSTVSADSLYAASTTKSVPMVQTPVLQWSSKAAAAPLNYREVEADTGVEAQVGEIPAASAPNNASWATFAVLPLAAFAGFMLGSRKSVGQLVVPETFEVVIDDGEEEVAMAATTGPKTSLYAVVAIGGHQYVVQPGQILSVDKLPLQIGDEFTFQKVLLLKDGEKVEFGRPYLDNAKVTAEVLRNSKGRKIRIFKYRAKKHSRLTKGHRQKYTDIHITEVAGQRVASKVNFDLVSEAAENLVNA